jgi:hypothetical protein
MSGSGLFLNTKVDKNVMFSIEQSFNRHRQKGRNVILYDFVRGLLLGN